MCLPMSATTCKVFLWKCKLWDHVEWEIISSWNKPDAWGLSIRTVVMISCGTLWSLIRWSRQYLILMTRKCWRAGCTNVLQRALRIHLLLCLWSVPYSIYTVAIVHRHRTHTQQSVQRQLTSTDCINHILLVQPTSHFFHIDRFSVWSPL